MQPNGIFSFDLKAFQSKLNEIWKHKCARMSTISELKIVKNTDNELQLICEWKLMLVICSIFKNKQKTILHWLLH